MTTKELIWKINYNGWVAFYYPRLRQVAINGGRRLPEQEARTEMLRMLATLNK